MYPQISSISAVMDGVLRVNYLNLIVISWMFILICIIALDKLILYQEI